MSCLNFMDDLNGKLSRSCTHVSLRLECSSRERSSSYSSRSIKAGYSFRRLAEVSLEDSNRATVPEQASYSSHRSRKFSSRSNIRTAWSRRCSNRSLTSLKDGDIALLRRQSIDRSPRQVPVVAPVVGS